MCVRVRVRGQATVLHTAVSFGNLGAVRELLDQGAEPNSADFEGATALTKAAACVKVRPKEGERRNSRMRVCVRVCV